MTKICQLLVAFVLVIYWLPVCLHAQREKTIKEDKIVFYVGVRDNNGRSVSGLKQENFKLYEGKEEKPINYFSDASEPASIGFVIDTSGSMGFKKPVPYSKIISAFVRPANSENEYYALAFSDTAKLTNFSRDSKSLLDGLEQLTASLPKGETKFFDAVRLAIESMGSATHKKKAVIIISDAQDNKSKTKFDQLKWIVRESNVLLYLLCPGGQELQSAPTFSTSVRFFNLVEFSGGLAFYPIDTTELSECLERIRLDLQSRYAIGFEPSLSGKKDGDEWHTIKVKIEPTKTLKGKLSVAARDGYYATRKQ